MALNGVAKMVTINIALKSSLHYTTILSKCNYSRFSFANYNINIPRLSPNEVTTMLRTNEFTHEFNSNGPVKSYDTNQLASNTPMEDTRAEAVSMFDGGLFFAIFDGHAGAACAQVLAKRLLSYVSAALLSKEDLNKIIASRNLKILQSYNDKHDFVLELKRKYETSFYDHLTALSKKDFQETKEAIEYACLKLDEDISNECVEVNGDVDRKAITVGMSGAVACLVHILESHLHVASIGDCQVVLGTLNDGNSWTSKKLSIEHNSDNPAEVERIVNEHPSAEKNTVLMNERLLGQLAPLRAFGDFRYKWSAEKLRSLAMPLFGESVIAPRYLTPPYLSVKPDTTYHRLTPRDKFLVIASDGLWDLLSPIQVVRLVGEHMRGKAALTPLRIPNSMKLKDIHKILLTRRDGLDNAPVDRNAATHLTRNALGGTELGFEHSRISQLLSLPPDVVRLFRDDITVTVVYFDSEFISHCPM